jgi:nucleoside-diphosphate-sugar epimerase
MKLLVLGGTRFVGRAVVAAALQRGADVTVVSRGVSGEPPAGVTWRSADRRQLDELRPAVAGEWDAVIDTWSEEATAVEAAAALLTDHAGWYGYVSSRSVYAWPMPPGGDESAPAVAPASEFGYAANKRGGELAVLGRFADRSLIARAGLILGHHEDTGRLTWWLERAALGGSLVAPEPPGLIWQFIDARDLATFLLDGAARRTAGTFNVVCPRSDGTTTSRLVAACVTVTGGVATPTWVGEEVLRRCGVREWDDLPGWIPPGSEGAGMHDCDVTAAIGAGLACRSIEETVADTWAWMQTLPPRSRRPLRQAQPRRGLTAEQEQAIWWLIAPERTMS